MKIGFSDFYAPMDEFFISLLSQYYEIEIDNENPEFLFFSVEDFGTQNKKFDNRPDVIKILYTGENRRAENYKCHYAITFDHRYEPWHYRLPLYAVDMWAMRNEYRFDTLFQPQEIGQRDLFCGFVHRNPSNQLRNSFFHFLSQYKQVSSAGPLLNNMGCNAEGIRGKIEFFRRCKFALCFENSSFPGYVTEKILHAYYAGCIPIYWGSQTIGRDFNPASFVYVQGDANKILDRIKEIDDNKDLYEKMQKEPKMLNNLPNDCVIFQNFLNWFDSIVYKKRYPKT